MSSTRSVTGGWYGQADAIHTMDKKITPGMDYWK